MEPDEALAVYNNPNLTQRQRVGLDPVPKTDQQLLDTFYKDQSQPAQTAGTGPDTPIAQHGSAKDASLLDEFYSPEKTTFADRFALGPGQTVIGQVKVGPSSFERDVAAAQSMPLAQGVGSVLRGVIARHPYAALTVAGGVSLPLLAPAGLAAIRIAPMLPRIGLSAIGLEKAYEYGRSLYDLMKP